MKIVHICLCGPVTDGWSYQDNLLPKYHSTLGHDVTIVASEWIYDTEGKLVRCEHSNYINENGLKQIRLRSKYGTNVHSKFSLYHGLTMVLNQEQPDLLFVHGCQFLDIKDVVDYVKEHRNVRIYVDNHADFSNSASNWLSKNVLHKIVWRHCAKSIEPYTTRFYGVLPARVDFLADMYKLPRNKIELLVMGADDELVKYAKQEHIRLSIREKHGIEKDDFLIMTGGKIDENKTQTLPLMEAVKNIGRENVKLVVFGSVVPQLKPKLTSLLCDSVEYIGWIDSRETYKYFNAADLVIFPGLHSVFWEQVVGLGLPCIFKYIDGFTHVDLGGNCDFLYEDSVEEIQDKILAIIDDPIRYKEMKLVAETKGMDVFSYRKIAEKSIRD